MQFKTKKDIDIFSILQERNATRQMVLRSFSVPEKVKLLKRNPWAFGSEAEERREQGRRERRMERKGLGVSGGRERVLGRA